MTLKELIVLYLVSCVIGFTGELTSGWIIKFATGNFLWLYPASPFVTTSLYVVPLWGLAGLICCFVCSKIQKILKGTSA